MLILIAGLRLRFIAILHIPIFYHWQQLQIGFIVLERQQEQAKNETKWSFDADYYCLFIQHLLNAYACLLPLAYAIAIQLFLYRYRFISYRLSGIIFTIKSSIPLFYYIPCTTMLVNALFQGFKKRSPLEPRPKELGSWLTLLGLYIFRSPRQLRYLVLHNGAYAFF